jgi:hypothetical protein
MTQPSVSFRISRSTETLAETVHALSQRLITMEQRLAAMEERLNEKDLAVQDEIEQMDHLQMDHLDNVDRLLQDCRELLETEATAHQPLPMTTSSDPIGTVDAVDTTEEASTMPAKVASIALEGNDEIVGEGDHSLAA